VELFDKVNRRLGELGRWFKKTEYVYLSRTRPPEVPQGELECEGEQIRRVEVTRFLGIWIDAGLNWRGHIGQVGTKVRQLLGLLGRIRADLNEHLLLSLYNSMVLPDGVGGLRSGQEFCLWGDPSEASEKVCGADSEEGGLVSCKSSVYWV
jgi:hypothetical protein